MTPWAWFGVLALLVSFVADVRAILGGRRRQGVALLVVFAVFALLVALQLRHTATVEAENRALTDVQARAQRLVDLWTPYSGEFSAESNSRGDNEGIVVAVADLLEDSRGCRPEAHATARRRLEEARERAAHTLSTSSFSDDSWDVWRDAADAAFQQLLAVSEVSPICD